MRQLLALILFAFCAHAQEFGSGGGLHKKAAGATVVDSLAWATVGTARAAGALNSSNAFNVTDIRASDTVATVTLNASGVVKGDSSHLRTLITRGKVGSGTTAPTYILDVVGTINASVALRSNTHSNGGGDAGMVLTPNKTEILGTTQVFDGNVGIGTATPQTKLSLSGTGQAGGFNVYNSALNTVVSSFAQETDTSSLSLQWTPNTGKPVLNLKGAIGNSIFAIDSSGNVAIGTMTPSATALLDVSSTTKGFLPPRMTTTQRDAISTPAEGLIIYNTTTKKLNFYNGTAWEAVTSL